MKVLTKVLTLVLASIMSLSAFGQTEVASDAITLKLKVYLESSHSFSDMADNLTVRIDEMIDRTISEQENKDGRFTLDLEVDRHYVLYFSQKGYETKSMVFSTVGADLEVKYTFRADIMLKRLSGDLVADHNSMASVHFDYMYKNEFVINENYSRINYSVKK
ncbi:MAG: hypothetical protein JKX73_09300 [Flavobacteriales bacterium]|nr:hypothetical protein [Flavobacteriales bacterium]